MLTPLTQFICDACGQVIETPAQGWLEWERFREGENLLNRDFRITHRSNRCAVNRPGVQTASLPLAEVVGDRAPTFVLSHLDIGPYHDSEYDGPTVANLRDYTEFMRRLTIPYYEEAKQWWEQAMSDGYFGDANEIYIYLPDNLQRMIEHYSEGE